MSIMMIIKTFLMETFLASSHIADRSTVDPAFEKSLFSWNFMTAVYKIEWNWT